ncbi:unnamed protein product [Parajaminaea phylloscopi]
MTVSPDLTDLAHMDRTWSVPSLRPTLIYSPLHYRRFRLLLTLYRVIPPWERQKQTQLYVDSHRPRSVVSDRGDALNVSRIMATSYRHIAQSKEAPPARLTGEALPFELCVAIFSHAIVSSENLSEGTEACKPPWRFLLLSRAFRAALEPVVYRRVSLVSTVALERFAHTLTERPDLSRKVKSLWIAPNSLESDFITALKPPPDGINSLPKQINLPIIHIKAILRACRSLRHLALDGCLCTLKASSLFGSNCQPVSVTSINPYSFLGGFSAPMFRKVKRLEVCDTSLASEEVEQIRTIPDLRHFIWTSPRDYSDSKRDVAALFRIVAPTLRSSSHLQLAVSGAHEANAELPVKPHQHRRLVSATVRTAQNRSAELGAHLKLAVAQPEQTSDAEASGDLAGLSESLSAMSLFQTPASRPYVDSSAHTTCVEHLGTGVLLKTERFPASNQGIVDEWEELRDLICGSGGLGLEEARQAARRNAKASASRERSLKEEHESKAPVSRSEHAEENDAQEQPLEPGRALRRLWIEWCSRVEDGSLEVN